MSIRSSLVCQPNDKFISDYESKLNSTDLLPMIFGKILSPKLNINNFINLQISLGTTKIINLTDNHTPYKIVQ